MKSQVFARLVDVLLHGLEEDTHPNPKNAIIKELENKLAQDNAGKSVRGPTCLLLDCPPLFIHARRANELH